MNGVSPTLPLPLTLAATALVLALAPLVAAPYTLTLLVIYAILAMSLGLIWGYGGILCFGQAVFFGLGAYAYAIAAINIGESSLPVLIGIAVPTLFAGLLGALLFFGRLSDVYLGVITLVVTLIFFKFMNATSGPEYVLGTARLGGFNGIPGFQTLNLPGDREHYILDGDLYALCAVLLLAVYGGLRLLLASPFGRVAVAIRENESRVELQGYDIRLRKTVLFAIGGGIAGLAGVLYANWAEIVTPNLFSLGQSAEIIIWCLLGGLGTLLGPAAGAVALGLLKLGLGQQAFIDNILVMGLVLVLLVLLLPRGVAPVVLSRLPTDLFRRRAAPRRRRHDSGSSVP